MKTLLISFITCFSSISSSPSLLASTYTENENGLPHRIEKTEKIVSRFSHQDRAVLKGAHLFLTHLYDSYVAGEGMIESDIHHILEAVEFAANKHQFQTRANLAQTPYIIHPIGVADQLLMIGKIHDPDILMGALLHDTVEDTDTSFEEIRIAFGERVEGFVREVTDDRSLTRAERKRLQIVHAPHKSAGAAQIKLSDKLYNLNDLLYSPPVDWTKKRTAEYFNWAQQVVNALPWVNAPLKQAVDQTIATYRESTVK